MSKKVKPDINESYDDSPVRGFMVKFLKDVYGLTYENHINQKDVDLVCMDKEDDYFEVEWGRWSGSLWVPSTYSKKSDVGVPTVNIPEGRKRKYWEDPRYLAYNISFARTNYKQVIILTKDVIMNEEKRILTNFKASNVTNNVPEWWWSYKKEVAITYNLIDGKWILETDDIATHLPLLTVKEIEEGKDQARKRVAELYKLRSKK